MPRNRVCAHKGCPTLLSTYNTADVCSEHGGWQKAQPHPAQIARYKMESQLEELGTAA